MGSGALAAMLVGRGTVGARSGSNCRRLLTVHPLFAPWSQSCFILSQMLVIFCPQGSKNRHAFMRDMKD